MHTRKGIEMSKQAKSKSPPSVEHDARTATLERLVALARRYPTVTQSLEFALEVAILAAQGLRQIAAGVREGAEVVAHRRAVAKVPGKGRTRRAT
jgi:hypothetical protein